MVLGKLPPRKIAPSPNFKASRKPNPDPDQGQFSGHPFLYNEFLAIFTKVKSF